uniref:Uncharacterized protein n=1 Tax=viral metagenome TaxID=1070528 RepID=A0A6C0C9R4_9ZZZZ
MQNLKYFLTAYLNGPMFQAILDVKNIIVTNLIDITLNREMPALTIPLHHF